MAATTGRPDTAVTGRPGPGTGAAYPGAVVAGESGAGQQDTGPGWWSPVRAAGRRRAHGRLAAAVTMIVFGVVGGWLVAAKSAGREPVLVTARPVPVGHVLAAADVRSVDLAGAAGLGPFTLADTAQVLGRPVAVPLPAGALLTAGLLGPAGWPPPGQAAVSVLVKPGSGPVVQPGQRVQVLTLPDPADQADQAGPAVAAGAPPPTAPAAAAAGVIGVVSDAQDADAVAGAGARLVTVLVRQPDAAGLAASAAAGRTALILLPPA
jgi:hypothetical protein